MTVRYPIVGDLFRYFNPVPLNPVNPMHCWLVLAVDHESRGSIRATCVNLTTRQFHDFNMYQDDYQKKYLLMSRLDKP